MSVRNATRFYDTFAVLHALSSAKDGLTIGQIEKVNTWMSRGQVERILESLSDIGFTYHEVIAHGRTGKRVFRITETAASICSVIAHNYSTIN